MVKVMSLCVFHVKEKCFNYALSNIEIIHDKGHEVQNP